VKLLSTDYNNKGVEISEWKILSEVEESNALFPRQVHGGDIVGVVCLKTKECEADGVVLDSSEDVSVGIVTADCAPVVIVTKERVVVLHVSRKTLLEGLLDNVEKYIQTKDILNVYIGPHICERHFDFETEGEEITEFIQKYPNAVKRRNGRSYLSIREALQVFFNKWGVSEDKLKEDGRCTYESDELPSYAKWCEEGRRGRLEHVKTIVRKAY
jgi:copper oxidase (laccase) domain-containing protein